MHWYYMSFHGSLRHISFFLGFYEVNYLVVLVLIALMISFRILASPEQVLGAVSYGHDMEFYQSPFAFSGRLSWNDPFCFTTMFISRNYTGFIALSPNGFWRFNY